ncbi:hypothetical protein ACW7G2_00320 [Luteimonas sp. A277]
MALTLGFTSMDQATETALGAAFSKASERFPGRFTLTDSDAADYVIIDMDSLYGPMGWLRLHAAGKHVIGLTAAARTQADFRLGRPFDTDAMAQLLQEITDAAGPAADPQTEAEATVVEAVAEAEPAAPADPIPLAVRLAVPPAAEETAAATSTPADAPATREQAPDVPDVAPEPEPEPQPEPEPAPPPRDPVFADWMAPHALQGRLRFSRDNGPELWIDADARQYHGPQLLKPLTSYFEGSVGRADFSPVDEATWNSGSAAAGPAQPLQRLQWLGGLLAGQGTLLPGHDPDGRYRLTKWQQTEREFARHFRIATAMMKGPVTLAEIAEASGAETDEVADFLNANLATGFAEFVPEPEPEAEAPPRPTGFFRRLRSRS